MSAVTTREIVTQPDLKLVEAPPSYEAIRSIDEFIGPICEHLRISSREERAQLTAKLAGLSQQELAIVDYLFVVEIEINDIPRVVRGASIDQITKLRSEIQNIGQQISTMTTPESQFTECSWTTVTAPKVEPKLTLIKQLTRDIAILLRLDMELSTDQVINLKAGNINLHTGVLINGDGSKTPLTLRLLDALAGYQVTYFDHFDEDPWGDSRASLLTFDDGYDLLRIADLPETAEDRAKLEIPDDEDQERDVKKHTRETSERETVSLANAAFRKAKISATPFDIIAPRTRSATKPCQPHATNSSPAAWRAYNSPLDSQAPRNNDKTPSPKPSTTQLVAPLMPTRPHFEPNSLSTNTPVIEQLMTDVWKELESIRKSASTAEEIFGNRLTGKKIAAAIKTLRSAFAAHQTASSYNGAIMELEIFSLNTTRISKRQKLPGNMVAAAKAVLKFSDRLSKQAALQIH